jgi:hypothetical protein
MHVSSASPTGGGGGGADVLGQFNKIVGALKQNFACDVGQMREL